MTESKLSCPKCQGEMSQGYVGDFTYGGILLKQWFEGSPEKSWNGTLKIPYIRASLNFFSLARPQSIPVGTFRCRSCGYLESYARDEFAAK